MSKACPQPVAFIERKRPDRKRVDELLALSQQANHWANGGPICDRLERRIGRLTGDRPGRAVVACANGTAALQVLAGVEAIKLGRPLRWAVSAFGFFSTFIGPFHGARVIDCDAEGMLDLDALDRLDPADYDGVCVTNLFGLHADLDRYRSLCQQHGKAVIVDNAYGLIARDRYPPDPLNEIISLHQTKPWGFGEGGCAIVSADDEPIARSLINFGVLREQEAAPYAFNGKMSDVAAAFILDRIEQAHRWRDLAYEQYQRIQRLIEDAGLDLVPLTGDVASPVGTGQLALLAPHPVDEAALFNEHFVMRKYYRPPWLPWPTRAAALYARVLNVPCHADMAEVSDEAIIEVLGGALRRSAPQTAMRVRSEV